MAGAAKQYNSAGFGAVNQLKAEIANIAADLEALRAALVAHQHAALNAAPSTGVTAVATAAGLVTAAKHS